MDRPLKSVLESCTGLGITVLPRLLRGNGDRVHGNSAGMGTQLHGSTAGTGTEFTVIPWERGDLLR